MPKVRVLSRIRRLSRGSTGFFGGNRLSFTNKRPTGRHRSVRKVRSIQIFPVGLIQIFPGNRKGANSNVFGGKKAKPYLTVAPYKVRTSSGPKLPVWNGSETHSTPGVGLARVRTFLIFGTAERTPFARKAKLDVSRGKTLFPDPDIWLAAKLGLAKCPGFIQNSKTLERFNWVLWRQSVFFYK